MILRKRTILMLLTLLLAAGCAKQGMPTGGPKDVTPPKTSRMTPPNGTLNSQSQDFYIEFDEYVVIKDAENNILISPPMKERPEVKTKGKGIKVTIKDTLQPNTTYLFQFKEAIADFNEGNLLPSVEYVFSTGDYIDSMMVKGSVVEALSMAPDKDMVSVWLMDEERYRQAIKAIGDTNVEAPQPNYITRTDKGGHFSFNNIKPGRYHVVAIKDEDKNNIVGIGEAVAFIDTTTASTVMPKPENTKKDSAATQTDSIQEKVPETGITLRLSTPKTDRQRLTGSDFISAGKVVLTSLLPLTDPQIDAGAEKITWRLNSQRDTLTLWTIRKECDSLQITVIDSSGINDTLRLRWNKTKAKKKTAGGAPANHGDMRISTSTLPYYDTLALLFSIPLDTSQCRLDSVAQIMLLKDSTVQSCDAMLDNSAMKAKLLYRFRQDEKYTVMVAKNRFTSIYGVGNDSINSSLTVTKAEDYGNLTLTINGTGKFIVDLLDDSGKTKHTKSVNDGGKVAFSNLSPMKYRVRVIVDSNGNGVWDSGDFASQLQPEKVVYLDKTLDIRANWDFEEELTIDN